MLPVFGGKFVLNKLRKEISMQSFTLKAQVGKADLDAFFADFDGVVKIDDSVKNFLKLGEYPQFETQKEFPVKVDRCKNGGTFAEILKRWAIMPRRDDVCAVLAYLGTPDGLKLLEIPKGEEEVNILLGYFTNGTKSFILHIEHKHEAGKFPEITIRGALPGHLEDGVVTVLLLHYK